MSRTLPVSRPQGRVARAIAALDTAPPQKTRNEAQRLLNRLEGVLKRFRPRPAAKTTPLRPGARYYAASDVEKLLDVAEAVEEVLQHVVASESAEPAPPAVARPAQRRRR